MVANHIFFFMFTPNPGEIIQFDGRIFFKWVGSTTNSYWCRFPLKVHEPFRLRFRFFANAAKKTGKVGWMFCAQQEGPCWIWNSWYLEVFHHLDVIWYVYIFYVFLLIRNEICNMCLIFCFELVNCWDQSFFSIHVWWITVCSSHPQCFCFSLSIWATKKKPPTFHCTGWLIGILIMVYQR